MTIFNNEISSFSFENIHILEDIQGNWNLWRIFEESSFSYLVHFQKESLYSSSVHFQSLLQHWYVQDKLWSYYFLINELINQCRVYLEKGSPAVKNLQKISRRNMLTSPPQFTMPISWTKVWWRNSIVLIYRVFKKCILRKCVNF